MTDLIREIILLVVSGTLQHYLLYFMNLEGYVKINLLDIIDVVCFWSIKMTHTLRETRNPESSPLEL